MSERKDGGAAWEALADAYAAAGVVSGTSAIRRRAFLAGAHAALGMVEEEFLKRHAATADQVEFANAILGGIHALSRALLSARVKP